MKLLNLRLCNFVTFLIFVFAFFFLLFNFASAQGGLVPCGGPNNPCDTCDFILLAHNIVEFLFKYIIAPLAALGILASGIVLLTAGGAQTQLETGKKMLWNIVIGFFIAVSAWVIINTILGNLVKPGYNYLTKPFPACEQFLGQ